MSRVQRLSRGIVAALLLAALAFVPACTAARTAKPASPKKPPIKVVQQAAAAPHGAPFGGVLDGTPTARASLTLAAARSNAAPKIRIPASEALGRPERAWSPDNSDRQAPAEMVPLGILYSSGVRFYAFPGAQPIPEDADETTQFAPYSDGRQKAFSIVKVDGINYKVDPGGVQTTPQGTPNVVLPCVTFVRDGIEYELLAPAGGGPLSNAQKLLEIAQTIK